MPGLAADFRLALPRVLLSTHALRLRHDGGAVEVVTSCDELLGIRVGRGLGAFQCAELDEGGVGVLPIRLDEFTETRGARRSRATMSIANAAPDVRRYCSDGDGHVRPASVACLPARIAGLDLFEAEKLIGEVRIAQQRFPGAFQHGPPVFDHIGARHEIHGAMNVLLDQEQRNSFVG